MESDGIEQIPLEDMSDDSAHLTTDVELDTDFDKSLEVDSCDLPVIEQHAPLSYWKLIALTIPALGVQFGWAIQIAFTSALFMELGVPTSLVSLVWLAGPISGLLVQPIVGVISDQATYKWGRRRPYILVGSLFIVLAMVLLSNAKEIGKLLGDSNESHSIAVVVAVIGFWILDLSNNTVQGPCRALILDVAPQSQQHISGSLYTFMLGLGNMAGYFIGSLDLMKFIPFIGSNLRGTFICGMIVLMVSVIVNVIVIKERQYQPLKASNEKGPNFIIKIWRGLRNMPKPVQRLSIVTFFTWVGWFTFFLYITVWVAQNIFHGSAVALEGSDERLLFDTGIREGAFALILNAIVSIVTSTLCPILMRKLGLRTVWFGSLCIMSVCLFLPLFINQVIGAYILIAAFGIPWTVVLIVPLIIVSSSVDESETGLFLGICNIFVVLPQLFVSAFIGVVVDLGHGNVAWALSVGGISCVIGVICVLFTKEVNVSIPNFQGLSGGH